MSGKGEDKLQHNWSGWPGAWCLNCGCSDPNETGDENYSKECPGPKDAHNPYKKTMKAGE